MILAQFPLRVAWPDLFIQALTASCSKVLQEQSIQPGQPKHARMATQERHSDALGRIMVRRLFAWYVYDIVCLVYLLISVIIFVNSGTEFDVWFIGCDLLPQI